MFRLPQNDFPHKIQITQVFFAFVYSYCVRWRHRGADKIKVAPFTTVIYFRSRGGEDNNCFFPLRSLFTAPETVPLSPCRKNHPQWQLSRTWTASFSEPFSNPPTPQTERSPEKNRPLPQTAYVYSVWAALLPLLHRKRMD